MLRKTDKSRLAYAMETPRGEHLSLQSKRTSPAVNRGPGQPTDPSWPLLYAAIPLVAIYLENSPTYSGII